MTRKFIKIIISVLSAIVCVFAFAACASKSDDGGNTDTPNQSSSINGTYYLYVNGSYDNSDFIKIEGESWSDKMGMTGFIELDGASISLKYKTPSIAGMPEMQATAYYGGTIGNGVFREESYMGIPLVNEYIKYYCKEGKTPSDLPSGGNNDVEPTKPTSPSDIKRLVTFDANGGYTSTATMQFEIGAAMSNMPTPTRNGYDFVGWKDSFGKAYDGTSKMPNNDITLIAQWTRKNTNYTDTYVSFIPAIEGTKNIATQIAYSGEVDKFVYVELTSDDLGGPSQVGLRNNFTLTTVTGLNFIVKGGYSWIWYENNAFNTPNGAQRFTLNYGSNFQFVSINDGSGRVLQTYLVDIYVKQDYNIRLYSDVDAVMSYETVRVIEGDYFSKAHPNKQVCDFVFDKHVFKTQFSDDLLDFDYSQPIAKDWFLYQTFKAKKITPELNGGILDGDVSVIPFVKEQSLLTPEKEGYDFIGWKLGDKYFTDIEGNSGVNYLNALNGNEMLVASFEPKHFYWYNDGDELKTAVATPSISYRDNAKTAISNISYNYNEATLNSSNTFIAGETATVTAVKNGYTFIGWYNDDTELSNNVSYTFTVPKDEFTYTRKWTYYTLTTDRNITSGGSVTNYYEQKVTAGDNVTITANTYSGYTFLGWYDGNTQLTDKLNYTFTMPEKNITYTAKWTSCPITFEKNIATAGSINVPSSTTIGQSVTVTATTNNGYTWLGWYNGNTLLTADTSYTFTLTENSATYTAKWTEYKLTTVANDTDAGYVSNYSNQSVTAGQSVTVTATTNNGYTFVGWYDGNRELTKQLSYTFAMPSANTTYTAKWIKVTLELSDTLAGTVSALDSTYKVGDSATVTATTNNGYTWLGWYNGNTRLTTAASYTFTMPSSNATYTAKWTYYTLTLDKTEGGSVTSVGGASNASFTVSFNLNGGTGTVASQTITKQTGLIYPTIPTRSGYVFAGWYNNSACSGNPFDFSASVTANTTLYAKWLSYSGNGVIDYNGSKTISVVSKDSSTVYYAFVPLVSSTVTVYSTGSLDTYGYLYSSAKSQLTYDDDSGDGNNFKITYTVTAGTLYYVRPCGYSSSGSTTVYISGAMPPAGGKVSANVSSSDTTQKITAGQSVTATATTNNGYTFVGWYEGSTRKAAELSYTFTMPSSNVTYTAKWIKVTIDRNDTSAGTVTSLNSTYKVGDRATVTATTNNGYTWLGWYSGNTLLTSNASYDFTMPSSNVTYTAKWASYTVTTNNDNTSAGTITNYSSQKVTAGQSVTITATSKNGYTFDGWYDGATRKSTEQSYTFTMPSSNVTYTAKWTYYTVTTNNDNTSAGTITNYSSQKVTAGQSVTITATPKNGYTFDGWYDGATRKSTEQSYTFTMPSSNVTYTAKWLYYTVTTERNNTSAGTVTNYNLSKVTVGQLVTITATTNTGYTFVGWYNGSQELSKELSYTFTMPSSNVIYTAKWSKVTLLKSNTSAGTISNLNNKYKVGDSVTVTATTYSGYTWVGWYNDTQELTKEMSYTFTMSSENVTYTAKWIICPITLAKNISNAGSVSISASTAVGKSATITATTYSGYTWVGWYNGTQELTKEMSYTFTMSSENATYTAKWIICPITLAKNISNAGSISMSDSTVVGEPVTITAETNLGYIWIGWYNGSQEVTKELSCTFTMPTYDVIYTAKWEADSALNNFTFTSTTNSLNITGFIDKTVIEIIVPDYVTSINMGAFSGCSSLTRITLPFIGGSIKTSNDSYQYPFGYIFGTVGYTGGTATEQEYYGYSRYSSTTTTYYVPTSLKQVIITGGNILYGAFYGCSDLTSVEIQSNLASIEGKAFTGCSSLTNIVIPDSVENVYYNAFYDCNNIITATMPTTALYSVVTANKDKLQTVVINGGASIRNECFEECKNLTSVEIPNSVISIGDRAFYGCSSLTSIEIPNSITSIGDSVFYGCNSLTSIEIPNSITSIGDRAFYGCSAMTNITIPSSITSIGNASFGECNRLTRIVIPNSVMDIGGGVFYGCSSLNNVVLNNSIKSLASAKVYVSVSGMSRLEYRGFFENCSSLTSITIPNSITNFGERAFYACSSLTSIAIPTKETSIRNGVFYGCSSLARIDIPNSVTSIENSAFSGCSKLTSITIPNSVTSIGGSVFYNCSKLTSIIMSNSVLSIGQSAFHSSGYYNNRSNWENGVLYIDKYLIAVETTISGSYTIKQGTVVIADQTFNNCRNLTSITMPNSVINAGNGLFYGCSNLTSVTLSNQITSLRGGINYLGNTVGFFEACSKLTSINIPNSVTSIGYHAFKDTAYYSDVNNWENGVLYIGKHLIEAKTTISGSYTIKQGTITIADDAFYSCNGLTSITMPNSVKIIGEWAFSYCGGLDSITIPNSVTSIGRLAFGFINSFIIYCEALSKPSGWDSEWNKYGVNDSRHPVVWNSNNNDKDEDGYAYTVVGEIRYAVKDGLATIAKNKNISGSIIIPSSVSYKNVLCSVSQIGISAFASCNSLNSIEIPNTITSIEGWVFTSGLTNIKFNGTKLQWNNITKDPDWKMNSGSFIVICTDGTLSKSES